MNELEQREQIPLNIAQAQGYLGGAQDEALGITPPEDGLDELLSEVFNEI